MIKDILFFLLGVVFTLLTLGGLFLYSVGKMHQAHGRDWDERV